MLIYLVWFNNFHGQQELVDIFAEKEHAQQYKKNHSDGDMMEIEERLAIARSYQPEI